MPKDMDNNIKEEEIEAKELIEVKDFKTSNKALLKKVSLAIGAILMALAILIAAKGCTLDEKENELTDDNQIGVSDTVNNKETSVVSKPEITKPESTTVKDNSEVVYPTNSDKWVTDTITSKETPVVGNVKEDEKLTKAQKAYIQEYVDYYDISWDDAKLTYFTYGSLNIESKSNTQEYIETYTFDSEDEAVIKELMSTLGMTRAEAEYEYTKNIAPSIGKTIQKVSTLKLK